MELRWQMTGWVPQQIKYSSEQRGIKFVTPLRLVSTITLLFTMLVAVAPYAASAQQSTPYPPSSLIDGITFDWETHDQRATGSDNWPITWADDDHQYATWGDGGGFGGTNSDGRVGLGFARIEGSRDNYTGFNVWGGKNGENPAQFEGKSRGIISIDGVLYAWVTPGANIQGYNSSRLYRSTDHAATWTAASWQFDKNEGLSFPTLLNFGKDYAGSRDDYVYHYFIELQNAGSSITQDEWASLDRHDSIALARSHKDDIFNSKSSYEFFAGLDGNGQPTWTSNISQRQPVFEDSNDVGWTVSVSYNAGLGRYILATEHNQSFKGNLGLFEAPEPWGPWSTIAYFNESNGSQFGAGQVEATTFFWNFSNKWLSSNGQDFTFLFTGIGGGSGNDSWNTIQGSFIVSDTSSPSVPSNLNATPVSESRIDLDWNGANDPESGVAGYDVYRNGSKVGNTVTASYSDTGLNGNSTYSYYVVAVNGAGLESSPSQSVNATTLADVIRPTIISATASDSSTVEVEFSEPVQSASATNVNNYSIVGISISSAILNSDLKTVILATSEHADGEYTLTVNNLKDRASNPNTIAANSQASYTYATVLEISNLSVASGKPYEIKDGFGNGKEIYIDRSFTYQNVPGDLTDSVYIVTANGDKLLGGSSFMAFNANKNITLKVLYDKRLSLPAWLEEFNNTGDEVEIAGAMHNVLSKEFASGQVVLGGNQGVSNSSMYTVIVSTSSNEPPPNIAPTARFNASTQVGDAPLSVDFDARDSNDPDGSITSYSWNFGDGSTGSGVTASHTYSNSAVYQAVLTVTDDDGDTDDTQKTITVNDPAVEEELFISVGDASVVVGGSVYVPIVLEEVTRPISGFEFDFELAPGTHASIESVEMADFGLVQHVLLSDSKVQLSAADINGIFEPDAQNLQIALIRIRAVSEGTESMFASNFDFVDFDGNVIETTSASGTLGMTQGVFPTLPGMPGPSQDLDGDGLAEDVNGNDRIDFADVVVMFDNLEAPEVLENPFGYDFNRNDVIDFGDVIALFNSIID